MRQAAWWPVLGVLAAAWPAPGRGVSGPDLEIGPGDIRYLPAFPRAGDRIAVAITAHNRGAAEARGVLLRYGLAGGPTDSTGLDIRGRDSVVIRWRVDLPGPGPWRMEITLDHAADPDSSNNRVTVMVGSGRRVTGRRPGRTKSGTPQPEKPRGAPHRDQPGG